jgi:hypothetical protein
MIRHTKRVQAQKRFSLHPLRFWISLGYFFAGEAVALAAGDGDAAATGVGVGFPATFDGS